MTGVLFNPAIWASLMTLCYALLGAYLLLGRGSGLLRNHLYFVVVTSVLWGVLVAQPRGLQPVADLGAPFYAVEVLLLYSWYRLLHRLLRGPYEQSMPEVVRRLLRLFWIVVLIGSGIVIWLAGLERMPWQGPLFSIATASIALVGFGLAAQLARDAPIGNRTALRPVVAATALATGSQAVLGIVASAGAGVPAPLLGLAAASLAFAGLLLLYALRLRPQWSLAIFVSPEARSYAPRFLAAGSILILALLLLPVLRAMDAGDAEWSALLLVVGWGLPVTLFLFSGRLNARLRVFVSKHFLPFRYDYREEWLRLIDTLVSPESGAPLPERVIRGVAQIVGSPAGVLWVRSGDEQTFSATASWNTRSLPDVPVSRDDPALRFMLDRQWTIDTAELARRPELYAGLQRPDWLGAFPDGLLIVPLISNDDLIGFIVLHQASSAFRLTFEEIDLLRTSGRQVAAFLAQYESDQKLAEGRQFEAYNRLTAFVMHDLKNLIAQQSLMVQNAARHKSNPAFFEDAMATIENSVSRMNKLLQQLQSRAAAGPSQCTGVGAVAADAIARCQGREPVPVLIDRSDDMHIWTDPERLTDILAHLIRNAQEACSRDGHVTVQVARDGDLVRLVVEDDGCGMEPEFVRTRLFRPFDTTKGSKGMGIGAYQARTFAIDAGGTLQVESRPGRGTRLEIRLPVREPVSATAMP